MVEGALTASSHWMSPVWQFSHEDSPFARAERSTRDRKSVITFSDDTVWELVHDGWKRVKAVEAGTDMGVAERVDVTGRHWTLECGLTHLHLLADSMWRRAWTIGPPGASLARIHGGRLNYNTIAVDAAAPVPVASVLLAFQIIVRAWEASAESVTAR